MLSPRPMALLALRDFHGLTWRCPEIPCSRVLWMGNVGMVLVVEHKNSLDHNVEVQYLSKGCFKM